MALIATSPSKLVTPSAVKDEARLAMLAAGQTDNPFTTGHWSQSLIIRTAIGLLVTAGVTLMLIRIADLVMLSLDFGDGFWKSIGGFILWQGLQAVGTFFGAMMATAGRNQMMTLGILLGMIVGFMTLIIFPTNPSVPPTLYFAMPAWFTVAGVFGAMLGEWLWHPHFRRAVRMNSNLTKNQQETSFAQLIRSALLGLIFANVRWLKVILAVAVIIPTLWYTHDFVTWVLLRFGLISWATDVGLQKSWVETMFKTGVIVFAVTAVGAGTMHGVAHGFWCGVFSGVINLLLHVIFPPKEGLPVNSILWEMGWVFVLCIISGGFGALVVPPMMYLAKKRQKAILR